MKPIKVVILVVVLCTMMIAPKVSGRPQDEHSANARSVPTTKLTPIQRDRQTTPAQNSMSAARKDTRARFDLRRTEEQGKILKKVQEGHSIANSMEQARRRADQIRSRQATTKPSSLKKAKLFGKTTRFFEAPAVLSRSFSSNTHIATNSKVLIDGKSQDSTNVGEPITVTFSFAPNAVSAVLNIYVDVDGDGLVGPRDILLTNFLLLDNDDNDLNSATGAYELRIGQQDFLTHVLGSFIVELNDFQSISSATVVVRQKPTTAIVLGTITPEFPGLLWYISGISGGIYIVSDTGGKFSFYVDRQVTSEVTLTQPNDLTGASNGYIPPTDRVFAVTSDTTNVSLAFSPGTSFIEGYLRDQTGAAVVGVRVNCYSYGPAFFTHTQTDSIGHYKLGVASGNCWVGVSPQQGSEYLYTPSTYSYLYVPSNTTVQRDFNLIHANSTISGKITLNSQGVAGIPISAYSDTLSNYVVTSGDGTYSVPVYNSSVATLEYTVSFNVPNGFYTSVSWHSNIQAGAVDVDFAIIRIAGGIQGRITDQNTGLPIANAQVSLSGISYKNTVSNDSGYYRMSLLDGSYYLIVDADRYYEYSESNIAISGSVITKNISLQKTGTISGTTKDTDGNPIPNASIYASSSDSTGYYYGYGYSDADGKYVLSGLRSSRYKVECSKYGYIAEWYDNVTDWQNASLVQVNDGFDTPNINFTLSRGGSISGNVTDRSGKPIPFVEIDVYDTSYTWQTYAITNDSGYYCASGLGSGKYYATTYNSIYFNQWYDGADSYFNATTVNVTIDHNTPDINFTLSAGSSISGKVTTKAGVPIAFVSIYVVAQVDSMLETVGYASTSDSGSYSIHRLKPGSNYYVYASAYGYASRWFYNVASFNSATAIVLQEEETRTAIDFTLPIAASISGKIQDKAGHAILSVYINVVDSLGSYIGYGSSDAQGIYTVTNLSDGIHYYVYASAYGYAARWYNNVASFNSATAIVLQEEETRTNIDFTLPPPGSISGRIRDDAGHPILYAYVNVVDSMGSYIGYGYPDSQGTYKVTNLSGGRFFATAYAYGYEQQWFDHKSTLQQADPFTVVEEQMTANINFDLRRSFGNGVVVTIAEARKDADNDLVPDHSVSGDQLCVFGVVTTPNLQRGISQTSYYIQDSTAGINVFSFSPSAANFTIGDSVFAFGTIIQFRGLTELKLLSIDSAYFGLVKHNAVVLKPKHLTLHEYVRNAESYEGQLIEIDTLYKLVGAWPGVGANATLYLINASKSDTTQMFIDLDTDIDGTAEPQYPINVVGIANQYSTGTAVYNNGYSIEPRGTTDIVQVPLLDVEKDETGIPNYFALHSNYPNPFNPTTTIRFDLPVKSKVRLLVFNLLGQQVAELANEDVNAGYFQKVWNANVASGLYFYRLEAVSVSDPNKRFMDVKKMILLK